MTDFDAYHAGWQARLLGVCLSSNSYPFFSPKRRAWREGWLTCRIRP